MREKCISIEICYFNISHANRFEKICAIKHVKNFAMQQECYMIEKYREYNFNYGQLLRNCCAPKLLYADTINRAYPPLNVHALCNPG
jgi:hypothetical protein